MKILPATNYCRYFPPFSMGHLWPDFFFQGMNIKMYHYQFLFPLLLTFDAGWKSLRSKSPSKLFKCEFRPVAPIVYWTHICNNDIDRNSDSSDMWSNYCVLTCWCFWCPPPLITLSNYTGLSSWWFAIVRLAISKWEHAMHHKEMNQSEYTYYQTLLYEILIRGN